MNYSISTHLMLRNQAQRRNNTVQRQGLKKLKNSTRAQLLNILVRIFRILLDQLIISQLMPPRRCYMENAKPILRTMK